MLSFTAVLALALLACASAQADPESERSDFEAADAALNEAYARAAEVVWPEAFERLRAEQREWLEARDPTAELYAVVAEGVAGRAARETGTYYAALAALTEMRTEVITALTDYYEDPSGYGWEGFWVDGAGGNLAFRELESGDLEFRLSVVRGPTYHTGWLEGIAARNGQLARFEASFDTGDGEEQVWVFFVREGPYLHVRTAHACYFHGARAYFDASYVRSRDLEPYDVR